MALVMPNGEPTPAQQGVFQSPQFQSPAQQQIGAAYQQYLGRPMNEADYASQTRQGRDTAPKNVDWAVNNIRNSSEAQQYQNSQQPREPMPVEGTTTTPPPVTGGSGYPSAPSVPASYGPSLQQMQASAASGAPTISSSYTPQQIKNFTGKELNIPQYNQTTFSQFQDPRNQAVQGSRDNLLLNLIQNPESLSQHWQDQMFEQQKDTSLDFLKQLGLQDQQSIAGRGLDFGGGISRGLQSDRENQFVSDLLAGRRDIATQAAQQNFADRLNVLGAAEQGLSGDTSRGSQVFQNLLAGQGAQAGENQFAAKYGFDSTNALADNERQNYQSYLGGAGLQGQENARGEQFRQSAFGLSEQSRQNAVQNALQSYLAENNTDLGWANYGLNADQQFLDYLMNQG